MGMRDRQQATLFSTPIPHSPPPPLFSCMYPVPLLRAWVMLSFIVGFSESTTVTDMENYPMIVVDKSGGGNYTTIQSAIDSVPQNNNRWICVYVRAGIYREKVIVPKQRGFIYLKGEGKETTRIVWWDHDSVVQSPTFTTWADHFFASSITFANEYNLPVEANRNPRKPAVAVLVGGDKSSFFDCGFLGVQDTLWDFEGRHYFKRCTISGAVDFIFGSGQSIYEECSIQVNGLALGPGIAGYVTAQGRSSPDEMNGFVFKECSLTGDGLTYLGRPWRGYARVLFYNTFMADIVVPLGWDSWFIAGHEAGLSFAEVGCWGIGANTSQRVKWLKRLGKREVSKLTSLEFIDANRWLTLQPDHGILC